MFGRSAAFVNCPPAPPELHRLRRISSSSSSLRLLTGLASRDRSFVLPTLDLGDAAPPTVRCRRAALPFRSPQWSELSRLNVVHIVVWTLDNVLAPLTATYIKSDHAEKVVATRLTKREAGSDGSRFCSECLDACRYALLVPIGLLQVIALYVLSEFRKTLRSPVIASSRNYSAF